MAGKKTAYSARYEAARAKKARAAPKKRSKKTAATPKKKKKSKKRSAKASKGQKMYYDGEQVFRAVWLVDPYDETIMVRAHRDGDPRLKETLEKTRERWADDSDFEVVAVVAPTGDVGVFASREAGNIEFFGLFDTYEEAKELADERAAYYEAEYDEEVERDGLGGWDFPSAADYGYDRPALTMTRVYGLGDRFVDNPGFNPIQNPLPKAYDPQEGYRYQILCRNQSYSGREWEHCDYAVDRADKNHLLNEYGLAYGGGWEFKSIMLPVKFWPKPTVANPRRGGGLLKGLATAAMAVVGIGGAVMGHRESQKRD